MVAGCPKLSIKRITGVPPSIEKRFLGVLRPSVSSEAKFGFFLGGGCDPSIRGNDGLRPSKGSFCLFLDGGGLGGSSGPKSLDRFGAEDIAECDFILAGGVELERLGLGEPERLSVEVGRRGVVSTGGLARVGVEGQRGDSLGRLLE